VVVLRNVLIVNLAGSLAVGKVDIRTIVLGDP